MEDIYGDLDNYEHVNDAEKLEHENGELRSKIEAITHELTKLREDYNKLQTEHKKLEANYSSLLKTAKAEIERKTQLISRLNTEKDQLVFRYLSTNRYLPCKQNVNTNPSLIDDKQNKKNHENISAESIAQPKEQHEDGDHNKPKDIADHSSKKVTEVDRNNDKKRMKDERITKRRKSMLEKRSARMSLSSLSSEDEGTDTFSDKNLIRKPVPPSYTKNSYGHSKGKYDNVYRKECRSQSPRESNDYRSRYEYKDRYSTKKYRQNDDWDYSNRYREVSPKPKRSYNYEIREESHRKSRRDGKDISESPPNERKQRYKSRDRYSQDHHYTGKDYQRNNEDSERDVGSSSHYNKIHEEYSDAQNRKRQLKEDYHDDRPVIKRRKDYEVRRETVPHGDAEKSVDLPFKISDVLQSPDEESVDVPVKDCIIGQVSEIKLVDPRLASEKYVQITDMCNQTSLHTIFGRDTELKVLHYDRGENVHQTPSPLKSTYDVCVKQVYENIDTQVFNTSIVRGEIIECDELLSMAIKNDSCFENRIQQEKIQCTENKIDIEADYFVSCSEKLNRQIVEQDLELSEDTCDNIHSNSKRRKSVSEKSNAHKKIQDKDKRKKYEASKQDKNEFAECSNTNIHNTETKSVESVIPGVDSNHQENKIPECVNENSIIDNVAHIKKKDKESNKTKNKNKSKEKEYKTSKHEKSKADKGFNENIDNINKKNEESTNSVLSSEIVESEIPDNLIKNKIIDNINNTGKKTEENKKRSKNKDKNKTPSIKTIIPKQSNLNNIVDSDNHLLERCEETKNSDVKRNEENLTAKQLNKNNSFDNVQVTNKNDMESDNPYAVLENETEEIPKLLNYTNIIDSLESMKEKDELVDDSDMASKRGENKISKFLKETNATDSVHAKKRDEEIDSSDMASKHKEIKNFNLLNESNIINKLDDTKEKGEESENFDAVSKRENESLKLLSESRITHTTDKTKENDEKIDNSGAALKSKERKLPELVSESHITGKVGQTKEKNDNSDTVSEHKENKIFTLLCKSQIIENVDQTKQKDGKSENSDATFIHEKRITPPHLNKNNDKIEITMEKNKKYNDSENEAKIATAQIEDDLITLEDLGREVRNSDSDLLLPKCNIANKVQNENSAIDSETNFNVVISNESIDSKNTETETKDFGTSTPVLEFLSSNPKLVVGSVDNISPSSSYSCETSNTDNYKSEVSDSNVLKPLHKEPEPDVRIFIRRNRPKKKQITGT